VEAAKVHGTSFTEWCGEFTTILLLMQVPPMDDRQAIIGGFPFNLCIYPTKNNLFIFKPKIVLELLFGISWKLYYMIVVDWDEL
jgi:hypothetical protein